MKIGLIQIDGKWPNLALMKISAWHKVQGDQVEWFNPLFADTYGCVYASKIFTNTPDYRYWPHCPVCKGGSGYDLFSHLPVEVEACMVDYSLYTAWDKAIGYTTRGCPNSCKFCIVPQKEGGLTVVADDIGDFWAGQKETVLLDNNLTAAPFEHFERIVSQIVTNNLTVDFSQGLDIRLLNEEHCKLLKRVRLSKRLLHFAWDSLDEEAQVRRGIALLLKYFHHKGITFYVLIGYNTTEQEDIYRVETLRGLGVNPFVMPYNKRDDYQRTFTRWCNMKAVFNVVGWPQYRREKLVG
jgi:radical SAM superfamily enzyme YgiQ (UPF0313 family)